MAKTEKSEQAKRRDWVESMLWQWGEQGPHRPSGYSSTSPTYRLMREGLAAHSSASDDPWRRSIRRRRDGRVTVAPTQTCHGRETASARQMTMTQPESDADKSGSVGRLDGIIKGMLTQTQQKIIWVRYVERVRSIKDVAETIGMRRDDVAIIHKLTLDMIHKWVYELRAYEYD